MAPPYFFIPLLYRSYNVWGNTMAWHPFQSGTSYVVREILEVLHCDLESGRVKDVRGKYPLLELFEPHCDEHAIFSPFGGAWGMSPYNPNVWKKPDGSDLTVGYRKPRARKPFTRKVRLEVMAKTGGHCYSCGQHLSDPSSVWIEHIIPFSTGGSDAIENLLPGCRICNYTRQNFTPHQIQRILSIGSVLVREIDSETDLGSSVLMFLESEDARRASKRKHKDYGFLVYKKEPPDKADKSACMT